MKRYFRILALLLVLIPSVASAGWIPTTITATDQVYTGIGTLHSIIAVDDGANACTVVSYDNTSAAGAEFTPTILTNADGRTEGWIGKDSYISTGVHITVTTAGTCTVWTDHSDKVVEP